MLAPLSALARRAAATGRPVRTGLGWGALAGALFFGPLVSWLIPFGVIAFGLLAGIQALWIGVFVAVLAWWGDRPLRPLVAVVLWVGIEVTRAGWPLGGFGWGVLGYSQHDSDLVLGAARTVGVYGVSAVVAGVGVLAEEVVHRARAAWDDARRADVPADAVFGAARTPLLSLLVLLTAAVLLGGEPPTPTGRVVEVGIAQGGDTRGTSAAGVNRLDTGRIERVAALALDATLPFADDPPDLVIWPENSLDTDVRTPAGAPVRGLLDEALEAVAPAPILAGEYRLGEDPMTAFNQMTVYTLDGAGDAYVKRRPVPFGEYVPARALLDWFPPLEQIPRDTLPGGEAQVVDIGGATVGAVICFENTFPALSHDQVRAGADLLVVSTNNSSFGDTAMSAQHLAFSELRAVETGRWVVHAGISGISAFISPEGEALQRTPLFTAGSPRREVPLVEGTTAATALSPAIAVLAQLGALAVLVVIAVGAVRRRGAPADSAGDRS